jgi:hypothetical protein
MNYSVVIPTYERPANLALILERLAQSVSRKTQVLILTEPDSQSLPPSEQLASWSDKLDIKVSINACKAGVDESILRAYEQCNAEWIYFLGDSKLPTADFEMVLNKAHTDCPYAAAYFFRCDSTFSTNQRIHSIEALVKSGLTLGDFILGGNSVFSRRIVEKYISYSYRTLSSRIAHVAMPLMALSKGDSIYVSNSKIIEKFIEKPSSYQPGKALLDCWASFSLLVLLPIEKKDAVHLNKYIVKNETFSEQVVFLKYCLLKIFREQSAISKELKIILNLRYNFYSILIEKNTVRILYWLSNMIEAIRRK